MLKIEDIAIPEMTEEEDIQRYLALKQKEWTFRCPSVDYVEFYVYIGSLEEKKIPTDTASHLCESWYAYSSVQSNNMLN